MIEVPDDFLSTGTITFHPSACSLGMRRWLTRYLANRRLGVFPRDRWLLRKIFGKPPVASRRGTVQLPIVAARRQSRSVFGDDSDDDVGRGSDMLTDMPAIGKDRRTQTIAWRLCSSRRTTVTARNEIHSGRACRILWLSGCLGFDLGGSSQPSPPS